MKEEKEQEAEEEELIESKVVAQRLEPLCVVSAENVISHDMK